MDIIDLGHQVTVQSKQYTEVMNRCSSLLHYSPQAQAAREYLSLRVPTYNVAGFVLGYFPDNKNLHLLSDIEDTLRDLDIVYDKYVRDMHVPVQKPHSIFSNHNIIMSYHNIYGDIIGLVGRTLLTKEQQKEQNISKYKNSSLSKGLNLFGMYNAKEYILAKDSVIIVEGQFDCITCHRYGFRNVVALGGATFSKFHFYLLKRYTNNIYLMLDNDDAGKRERDKIISQYGKDANIKSIELDSRYKDIDEYLISSNDYLLLAL